MNTRAIATGVALITIAIVVAVVVWESSELVSPGPLHPSHAGIAMLTGRSSCTECHNKDEGTMADACLVCHSPINEQYELHAGIHGGLDQKLSQSCGKCHVEHVEGAVHLVSDLAFTYAGVTSVQEYDHAHAEAFGLEGAHNSLACERCHTQAWAASLQEGQFRYLGQVQACASCHGDPHQAELPNCAECHGQEHPFEEAPGFEHDGFELVGGHSIADCRACHEDQVFTDAPTECASCHLETYEATQVPAHASIGFEMDCASCHTVFEWPDTSFEHPEVFSLEGSHDGLTCADCHSPEEDDLARVTGAACIVCHDSPHSEVFAQGIVSITSAVAFDQACTECHSTLDAGFGLPDARLSAEHHAATGFSLVSPHDVPECAACHGENAGEIVWTDAYPGRTADECQVCHDDPHEDQFIESWTEASCLACHDRERFTPSNFDVAMHEQCEFPLTGGHRAIACYSCHEENDNGSMIFVPTPSACADCHDDVHSGRFDRPTLPAQFVRDQDCSRCHVTAGFNEVAWTNHEHKLWTGYGLDGAHADITCVACHEMDEAAPLGERFAVPSQACASCHDDPHAGQFDAPVATDCIKCHQETSFTDPIFDHAFDSRLALDEHHVTLDCAQCHQTYQTPAGPIIRYRPLGTECIDCHGDQSDNQTEGP